MLNINTETFEIAITRGDTASIVFSAVEKDGTSWNPEVGDEKLVFAVAKKWGGDRLMEIVNTYSGNPYTEVEVDETTFNANKTNYWYVDDGEYVQCTNADTYDSSETYYLKDWASFWTINITRSHWLDENGNDKFKFADYVYDVQVATATDDITIIGKDDDNGIEPIFKVLGEVAPE